MFVELTAVRVSDANLPMWLALAPPLDEGALERLRTELRDRPDRSRVVLSDALGPAVAFVVDRQPPGATTWTPRLRAGFSEHRRDQVLRQTATYIRDMCETEGLRYLECTLKRNTEAEVAWRDAMLSAGFDAVARKCHYECAVPVDASPKPIGVQPKIVAIEPADERIERLFARTLVGSLDRSTVFEGRHGGGLGAADHVLIAYRDQEAAGLCALEHQDGAARGWLKYVGTVPEARRTGVANALVVAGLTCLAREGTAIAECLIDVENRASISLHERFGFRATGVCGESYYASLSVSR